MTFCISLSGCAFELAFEGDRPPLILDDVCVMLDDERADKVISLLAELSVSRQIILFTCRRAMNCLRFSRRHTVYSEA